MEMFLLIASMIVFAIGVMAVAFSAATRNEPSSSALKPQLGSASAHSYSRFFKRGIASLEPTQVPLPIEALLLQIENHIRLEQAAAESFLAMPTAALLHCKTISPLMR